MYNILGLNFGHDGSAAIVRDGRLVSAISNERLSRKKKAKGVTAEMISYVLEAADLTLDDVDYVACTLFHYQPDSYVKVLDLNGNPATSLWMWEWWRSRLVGPLMTIDILVEIDGKRFKSVFVNHHMAHAASAYYTSPFEQAACFTVDASHVQPEGCSMFAYSEGNKLHYHSCPGVMIGNAYSDFTYKLGLGPGLTKAGTTMALASYGRPKRKAVKRWRHYGQSYFSRTDEAADEVFTNRIWSDLSGLAPHARLSPEQSDSLEAMNIAASVGYIFERTLLRNAKRLRECTRGYDGGNLCLAGGSFLNCNVNSVIREHSGFERLHLFPGCGDDGTAVGAALYLAHHVLDAPRVSYRPHEYMFTGRTYAISKPGGERYDAHVVARALSEGKIVAFFHGGSEFGPRALGHRSLLADPRNATIKDTINHRVKHREWFRPFAPTVLSEKASEWFDIDFESKLMLFTFRIRRPDRLPAVAHVDGTARLQTLAREDNAKLYDLIAQFERITGVPLLLNTSLNDNGEPLVETPDDALRFFREHDVDLLVLEDRMFMQQATTGLCREDSQAALSR